MAEKQYRLLLVDDQAHSLALLSRRLAVQGYETSCSPSGSEALVAFAANLPDLVVLDMALPDADGADIAGRMKKISQEACQIPIIMTSTTDSASEKVRALDAGADGFMTKPIHFGELMARIGAQLRIAELQRQLVESEKLKAIFEMAGAACHELAQPLTAVIGYTQMLMRKNTLPDPERKSLENLEKSAARAADVIARIRRIERYEVKAYGPTSSIIDLARAAPDEEEKE
jgi:DNA-binding response OmpR family regulator